MEHNITNVIVLRVIYERHFVFGQYYEWLYLKYLPSYPTMNNKQALPNDLFLITRICLIKLLIIYVVRLTKRKSVVNKISQF